MKELPDGKLILTLEEAISYLPDKPRIHTFLEAPIALVGADWDRAHVIDLLTEANLRENEADRIEATGPGAQAMYHGIAVWRVPGNRDSVVYIETKERTDGEGQTQH